MVRYRNLVRLLIAALAAGLLVFTNRVADAAQGPFDDRATGLQLTGVMLSESWDKNGSSETLGGGMMTVVRPFRGGWMGAVEATFMRVVQDGSRDPYVSGFSVLIRRRVYETRSAAVFVEIGPGISYANRPAPLGGTRMNYLFQSGAGALIRIGPGAYLVPGVRYLHLSNNSLAGRGRNPDIQALGGYVGTMLTF